MFAIIDRSQMVMPDSSQNLGVTVQSATPGSNALVPTGSKSFVLGVGPTLSGRVAGYFSAPVGLVSMDWKFTVGGTVQVTVPVTVNTPSGTQVGTIVAVTPATATTTNTIEVAFPSVNGQPPASPNVNSPITFPDPITMAPTPFTELGVSPQPVTANDLKRVQYGYPGPQPRFSVGDNPLVVPYWTIID